MRANRYETGPVRRQIGPQMREDGSLLNKVHAKSNNGIAITAANPIGPPGMRNPRGMSGSVLRNRLTDNNVITDVATRNHIYVAMS